MCDKTFYFLYIFICNFSPLQLFNGSWQLQWTAVFFLHKTLTKPSNDVALIDRTPETRSLAIKEMRINLLRRTSRLINNLQESRYKCRERRTTCARKKIQSFRAFQQDFMKHLLCRANEQSTTAVRKNGITPNH